jgi:hypothetical protein
MAVFASIYVKRWASLRMVKDGETTDDLFAFLTTESNAGVGVIHSKAMPVILTSPQDIETRPHNPGFYLDAFAACSLSNNDLTHTVIVAGPSAINLAEAFIKPVEALPFSKHTR